MSTEKDFDREVRDQLKRRARIVKDTDAEIRALLARALERTLGILADQPTDYQLWSLPQVVKEIGIAAAALGDEATAATARAAQAAWAAGADLVVKPLEVAGLAVTQAIAPHIDQRQLQAMKHFLADKMKDVSLQAANRINGELGLVVIGAQTPHEAQVAIRAIIKEKAGSRAATIVRTELLRVYSIASYEAGLAAEDAGVGLDKVWRRSGKAHPRISHALADGQRVAWDQPFMVGGVKMMHPHDPKAPAKETINCGCVMIQKPRGWRSTLPDKRAFTRDELAKNPTLKAIVEERADMTPDGRGATLRANPAAYDVAKAGGKHAGWLRTHEALSDVELERSLKSFNRLAAKHERWMADPASKVADFAERDPRYQKGLLHGWRSDIERASELAGIVDGILRSRKDGKP